MDPSDDDLDVDLDVDLKWLARPMLAPHCQCLNVRLSFLGHRSTHDR
jgi:hypothetical protein